MSLHDICGLAIAIDSVWWGGLLWECGVAIVYCVYISVTKVCCNIVAHGDTSY